jgi:hypothetical protein
MNGGARAASPAATVAVVSGATSGRRVGLRLLSWAFTLFNSVRMLAYLPTTWAIYTTGDSSQHSLWTWCTWLGANATMAAWLHENNGHRIDKAVLVNTGNAAMCFLTVLVILQHRF